MFFDGKKIALLFSLVYSLCWILPNHHAPWHDFYADAWAAGVLWLFAAWSLARVRSERVINWHALPLVALACCVIVLLQYSWGLIESLGVAWTNSLFLLGLAFAMVLGATLERLWPGQCPNFLFAAVLSGASGSLIIQMQQWLQIDPGAAFWLFLPAPPARFHANLGQPNQLASLLCLGVLACAWFYQNHRLNGWVAWIWSILLAVGLALAESRTSWLVVIISLAMLLIWRKRLAIKREIAISAFGWAFVFAILVALLPYANFWMGRSSQLGIIRGISYLELRFEIWSALWGAVLDRPWFGYGWLQTSFAQFSPNPYDMVSDGTHRHAHNLILDIFVFIGIPLGMLLCLVLAVWAIRVIGSIEGVDNFFGFLFLMVLIVHALLEYPLYYAYFLLPFGMMVGVLNQTLKFNSYLKTSILPLIVLLCLLAFGLIVTWRDYLRIENDFFSLRFEYQKLEKKSDYLAPEVISLTHLQDSIWLARVDPALAHSEEDLSRALKTVKLLPSTVAIYKLASMYAFAGMSKDSEYWILVMTRLNRPSDAMVNELHRQWREQSEIHPILATIAWPSNEK